MFSVGPPYRKPLWTNGRLVATLVILVALTCWCVLAPPESLEDLLELEVMPFSFRVFILALAGLNLGVSLMCEKYLFGRFATAISNSKNKIKSLGSRQGYHVVGKQHKKIYKKVMDDMGIHDNNK